MVYKYLGYGVTDENGVAKLDHDADGEPLDHSYTGVGAGKIDVLASLDKPIVDGSIVSEPCNVLDTKWKDVVGDFNNTCISKIHCTANVVDGVREIVHDGTENFGGINVTTVANPSDSDVNHLLMIDLPFVIELDVTAISRAIWKFYYANGAWNGKFCDYFNQTGHYKVVAEEGKITEYRDGTQIKVTTGSNITGSVSPNLAIAQNEYISYKNYVIYPI